MGYKRLGDMRPDKRMEEIRKLQLALPRSRRPKLAFPDLSVGTTDDRKVAPLSNTIAAGSTAPKALPAGAKVFPSATMHKQGPMLITPGDIRSGRVKDFGGHKPNHHIEGGD